MNLLELLNDLVDLANEAQEHADANPGDAEAAHRARTLANAGMALGSHPSLTMAKGERRTQTG